MRSTARDIVHTRPSILAVIALLLALASALSLWRFGRSSIGFDYYQFWVVSQSVSGGLVANIYDDRDRTRMGEIFLGRAHLGDVDSRQLAVAKQRTYIKTWSTPFLYSAFRPLVSGDYERDYAVFRLLGLISVVLALGFLCWQLGYPAAGMLFQVAVALCCFEPLRSDVRVGNVNQIQLGLLAVFAWLGGGGTSRALAGGLLLGLAVAFKPNLASVVVVLAALRAAQRHWNRLALEAAGIAAGVGAAVLLSALEFGSLGCWSDWFRFLSSSLYDERAMTVEWGNFSIDRLVFEAMGMHVGTPLALVLVAALGGVLWHTGREGAVEWPLPAELWTIALGPCLGLLVAPLSFLHYYVLLLPIILLNLRPGGHSGGATSTCVRQVGAALAFVAFIPPHWLPPLAERLALRGWLASSAALVLYALSLADLAGPARTGANDS